MAATAAVDAGAHQRAAPARLALYGLLADLFTYPSDALVESCGNGELVSQLCEAAGSLPYALPVEVEAFDTAANPQLGPEFIRLFDVPLGGSTCPLYGGVLGGDRREVMEDLLRFYRHFGLSTANAELRDLPDSIPTVLEFLGFLAYRESQSSAGEALPFRRAQHDVLERHLTRWAPIVVARVARLDPPPIYGASTHLLERFVSAELPALDHGGAS